MRKRGWIRLLENEGNCHIFFSTHCVTPGCYMPLPLCLALALYSSSPPFFFFSCPKAYYIFSCALSLSPLPFTPFSLTPLLCPPVFFSLRLKCMHYFQPWLCGVDRESRTMAAFESHDRALEGGGGLQVFFFLSTVNSNRLMQLAYYWHIPPQQWTETK